MGSGVENPFSLTSMNIGSSQIHWSLDLGSLVANVGKTRAITNHYQSIVEDWNLAIEEFHAARISQCLCLELFEISVFTNVGRVS